MNNHSTTHQRCPDCLRLIEGTLEEFKEELFNRKSTTVTYRAPVYKCKECKQSWIEGREHYDAILNAYKEKLGIPESFRRVLTQEVEGRVSAKIKYSQFLQHKNHGKTSKV